MRSSRPTTVTATVAAAVAALCGALLAGPAVAGTAQTPPDPCKTFTVESFDVLFGLPAGTTPTERHHVADRGKATERRTCVARSGEHVISVSTSYAESSITGPFRVYHRPKLGHSGEVLVSTEKSFPETVAIYQRRTVFFTDLVHVTLKHRGRRLYRFALVQSRAFAAR
jgi:hypothetical protein